MASNTYKTISLKGTPIRFERVSMEAITPGHLVQLHTDGKLKKHATAAVAAPKAFACENETPWEDITGNAIDKAWASGDRVQYGVFHSGCVVNAVVAAAAPAIVYGDGLESAGNGTVRKVTTGVVIGWAEESVDNSGGSAIARIAMLVA